MSPGSGPFLSIIIVSYNVKDFLTECLSSLHEFLRVPYEVVVVDNASVDGTCIAVRERFNDVKLIENKHNAGFSAANNQGLAIANGDYLLLLNPDARLKNSSIGLALHYLALNEGKKIILGPRIFNPDNTFQPSAWKFPGLRQLLLESVFLNKLIDTRSYKALEHVKEPFRVDFLSGAGLLMSKQTQESIGLLDENLFWMDDVDYCYRNTLDGGVNDYFPQWEIVHHIGASSKKNVSLVISNQIVSKLKFFKKHLRGTAFFVSVFILLAHIKIRLLILLPASIFSKEAFVKLKAYWYALKKFFRYLFLGDGRIN